MPRKRIATYGKAARKRIPDYNFASLAHRSQRLEIKSELLSSRSPSVAPVQETQKVKSVASTSTSRTVSPPSPPVVAADIFGVPSSDDEIPPRPAPKATKKIAQKRIPAAKPAIRSASRATSPSPPVGADIFDVLSSDDEARLASRSTPKTTKKTTQTRITKVTQDITVALKEDAESRKRVKLSPARPALQKQPPVEPTTKASPPRSKALMLKQPAIDRGLTTTVVARPKPTLQKKTQHWTPRKISPIQKNGQPRSTPSPQACHADMMDIDTPTNYISPRGLQMWNDLLEPWDGDENSTTKVEENVATEVSVSISRVPGKTLVKPAAVSKPTERSPRKLPRRRLIDSLVEQATHDEDMGEGDSDSNESDILATVASALTFPNSVSRSQIVAPEAPSPPSGQSQSQSQPPQVIGPKFTYSKQRSMLAEEDFMKQLELDMPHQPIQSTLGKKPRRGVIPTLPKLQSFHEEEDNDDSTVGIRSVHELRQAGANNRFLDEIEDLLDRIGSPTTPSSMRRSGLLDLASKIKDKTFTRQFRSNGVEQRLFMHMGRETDLIAGFVMVSILMALLADANILPHVVTQLRTQGIARLFIRLLECQISITALGKDRKSNMSKVAQSLLAEHSDYLLKLSVWEELKPKTISPRTVALKCLELMVRQTREAGNSGDLISKQLTTNLFSILKPASDESVWDLPSGKDAVDFCLALSALESHSITARTLRDETIWISDYLPIIADTLEIALKQPVDDYGVLQALILRLTLNVTNNNQKASDVFARQSLIAVMGQVIVSKFKKISRFLTEEDFSVVVDHLILALGVMINFSEWSSDVRNSLQSAQGTLHDPLDDMVQLFIDNQESTSLVRIPLIPCVLITNTHRLSRWKKAKRTSSSATSLFSSDTYLASGINDLSGIFLAFILDNLAKRILNRRIIALHEMPVHELHRERRFACCTRPLAASHIFCTLSPTPIQPKASQRELSPIKQETNTYQQTCFPQWRSSSASAATCLDLQTDIGGLGEGARCARFRWGNISFGHEREAEE